jgi:hypothetical protein
VLITGCSHPPAAKPPAPAATFAAAIENAARRVEAQDYLGADRILSDFALSSKGSAEAQEISFWRALYMVDPNNKTASIADGIRAMDIYLATPGNKWYRTQAQVVRRTAMAVQSLRTAQAAAPPPKIVGRDTVFVNREDEIAGLKDQLAKANAELDRIKKRLANPSR